VPIAEKTRIMDAEELRRTLRRLAAEIVERGGARDLALVGIRRRGVPIARRIAHLIAAQEGGGEAPPVGELDIAFYGDDLTEKADRPLVRLSAVPFAVDGRRVVLVDDVLYTARTARAALDAMADLGRPAAVQLAVLVDRGHRVLPIHADYVGRHVPTSGREVIEVRLVEVDGRDEVWIMQQTG
jgi:pyrimidine operon attenuation protein/uracil phosphoribosyltransferase